ncbi:hypothetical protein PR048_026422 [Dryococelus australis]|uniref:Uncharacterized protein n=1 Tax=Dryococelus australis TaxID=614101 RepID=A0ABQ9GL92_9NEOP|nr:hypothetical protein PR048_026422 [Dryococelus australis]
MPSVERARKKSVHIDAFVSARRLPSKSPLSVVRRSRLFLAKQRRSSLTYRLTGSTIRLPTRRTGFESQRSCSRMFECGNRAERCHWSADFSGFLRLPRPMHSGAATYSPRYTLIGSQYRDVKSRPAILGITTCSSYARLHHCGSKLDPRSDLRSTQKTVAPFEFRAGLEIEMKFILNHRNWLFEISIRDQQPSSTNLTLVLTIRQQALGDVMLQQLIRQLAVSDALPARQRHRRQQQQQQRDLARRHLVPARRPKGGPLSIPGDVKPDFHLLKMWWTLPWNGGFSHGFPVYPVLAFRRRSISTSFHTHRPSKLRSRPAECLASMSMNSQGLASSEGRGAGRQVDPRSSVPTPVPSKETFPTTIFDIQTKYGCPTLDTLEEMYTTCHVCMRSTFGWKYPECNIHQTPPLTDQPHTPIHKYTTEGQKIVTGYEVILAAEMSKREERRDYVMQEWQGRRGVPQHSLTLGSDLPSQWFLQAYHAEKP